ncbi:MAG: hypothetical protein J5562_01385 [Clostridia bacterium]|nr:hypothetical protein [Clostridia bacterium]
MRKAITAVAIMLVLCFALCSCSFTPIRSMDLLMQPPVFSNTDEKLIAAFETSAGDNTVFCTPINGDYKSAVVVEDVDSDGEEEAFIFYKLKNGQETVRLNILKKIGGEWKSVSDFTGSGTSVGSISFIDLDSDGIQEVFAGWRVGTSSGRILSIFRQNSDRLSYHEIMNESYSLMSSADIDGDGETEVLLISQISNNTGNLNSAALYKCSGGKMNPAGNVTLDGNISSYVSVKGEKTSAESPMRFYVDALKGERMMITEVISWDNSTANLVDPFVDPETFTNSATLRYEPIPSMDINGDGLIDIPTQSVISEVEAGPESIDSYIPLYLTEWKNISDDGIGLETSVCSLINTTGGYIFYLTESDLEKAAVTAQTDKCWIFRADVNGDGVYKDMFSLLIIDNENWNEENAGSYTILSENENYRVCAFVSPDGKANGISGESVKEYFEQFTY